MLISIQSAGVAPEVNLRINANERAHKKGIYLALKPRTDVTRSPKQGYQWPMKRTYVLQKFKKEKEKNVLELQFSMHQQFLPGTE